MGKKKTTNRGRKPAAVGEYKDPNDDQKRSYHKNAMRKHRGLPPVEDLAASNNTTASMPTTTTPPSRRDTTRSSKGRPPVMGLVAMTPTTLQGRKRHLMREKRKKERISKKSKVAAKLRFTPSATGETDNESSEDETEIALNESNDMEVSNDESTDHHLPVSNLTPDALRKAIYRAKCRLRGVFTNNSIDNLKLLLLFNKAYLLPIDLSAELSKLDCVLFSDKRKYKYRVSRLTELFISVRSEIQKQLLQFWIENILLSRVTESLLTSCNVVIPEDILPKSLIVIRNAAT